MKTYETTLVELSPQPAAVVRTHLRTDGIAAFVGAAFGEVVGAIGATGQEPAGLPFARYHMTGGAEFDVAAGFPVTEPVPAQGRVEMLTLPGGPALKVLHRGAYDQVAAAYEAGTEWMTEHGYEPAGDPWECYLDGPEVAEPRTEVLMPCQKLAARS